MTNRSQERVVVGVLILLMLLTGTVNTIATKYQDIVCVEYNEDGTCKRKFKHFAVQSAEMFIGEILCLLPAFISFLVRRTQQDEVSEDYFPKRYLGAIMSFAVPALCDVSGTTLLNIGIFYTYPSVFQMLRGTVVFFAGIFTTVLLRKHLSKNQWIALVLIVFGAGIVGSVSVIPLNGHHPNNEDASNPLLGNILVISAQIAAAFQFIIEEKYLARYKVPANVAVGLEGCWGLLACMIIVPIMSRFKDSDGNSFDSLPAAIDAIKKSRQLQISTLGSVLSIAFFNFFGITLTKKLSGASRATIDACRTIFVWVYSLHVGWEEKSLLKNMIQVVGFLVLVGGTSLFNGLFSSKSKKNELALEQNLGEEQPLLSPGGIPVQFTKKYLAKKYTLARSFRLGRSLFSVSPSTSFGDLRESEPRNINGNFEDDGMSSVNSSFTIDQTDNSDMMEPLDLNNFD